MARNSLKIKTIKPSGRRYFLARWRDPQTGRPRSASTRQTTKRGAERYAADLARRLDETHADVAWADFCETYEGHALRRWSNKSAEAWGTVKLWLTRLNGPATLAGFDKRFIARWQSQLQGRGLSRATVATYAARLKAALRWAEDQDLIQKAPTVHVRPVNEPRAREVRGEEFDRMLAALPAIRPKDHAAWSRLLRAFWWSDFRLQELRVLSWNSAAPLWIDLAGEFPMVRISQHAQKGRRGQWHPILPEFWEVCCETPPADRRGRVFLLPKRRGGQLARRTIQKVISQIGRRAGVVTNSETGKTASAHDLRRGFATRMSAVLSLPDLQKWMRHTSPSTTLTYYHHADAEQLAAKVWANAMHPMGATLGATTPMGGTPAAKR